MEPYSSATDQVSGLPQIGAGGQLVLPGMSSIRPTPYRYAVLIERAKQLVNIAQPIETAMFNAVVQQEAEEYNSLKARQEIQLTLAGVQLQDLRVQKAKGEVALAELQQQRAELQVEHYADLLTEGLSSLEEASMQIQITVAAGYAGAALLLAAGSLVVWDPKLAAMSAEYATKAAESTANILAQYASFERRREEWEFQKEIAEHDIRIGAQQIKIAQDQVRVVGQERNIANLKSEHARDIAEFLANKFTNIELYDWMSDILESVYSFFLHEATATAKLAENQLAFERQEIPPHFIQDDYWEAPSENMLATISGKTPDRRGLTGSARLLQDIYRLDQYAFETDKRKLQLSKTISLAQLDPVAFQGFCETGVLPFRTPMEMFDRDFPGHYLRLIKRVRTTVVALIPPTQGIHATLTTAGASRVVIGGDIFQTIIVRRDPEVVALTSPNDASGVFDLQQQSEMLLPFEGHGVDASWEFRLLKPANLFDYGSIADVLVTIDYTALNSFDHYQQVIQSLRPMRTLERPFSFRHELADAWYDLHNPEGMVHFPVELGLHFQAH